MLLRMEAVSKKYRRHGTEIHALRDASLEVAPGEYVSITGPSGSGKSTLLLTLGGMMSPTSGRVLLAGQSLYDLSPDRRAELRRRKIGFVFQTFNLVPYLSALENVQVPLLLAGAHPEDQQAKARRLLGRLGLADRLDHKPAELSVGQQQRVALARTMANDPEVILADEPTGNLDPETGCQVLAFLEELNAEGRTVVLITHDHAAARRARRRLRLAAGRVQPEEPKGVRDNSLERQGDPDGQRDLAAQCPGTSR